MIEIIVSALGSRVMHTPQRVELEIGGSFISGFYHPRKSMFMDITTQSNYSFLMDVHNLIALGSL